MIGFTVYCIGYVASLFAMGATIGKRDLDIESFLALPIIALFWPVAFVVLVLGLIAALPILGGAALVEWIHKHAD